jgi:HEAT repeat protein
LAHLDGERAIRIGETLISAESVSRDSRIVASHLAVAGDATRGGELLMRLVDDDEPAVVAVAAGRLMQIDPMLLADHAERLMGSSDARLREVAMLVFDTMATPRAVESLAWMLNDANPHLRAEARLRLHGSDGNPNLTQTVREAVMAKLASNATDAIVESAVLLGRLDHQPAAPRLVELLGDSRHEVRMAAIVGLRWLANEQTYPRLYEHAMMLSKALLMDRGRAYAAGFDAELRQVLQTFGAVKFMPADAIMRQFVPRVGGNFSAGVRSSAIWALGRLHEDVPDEALAVALVRRLVDVRARWSERHEVRLMAAVALGMMRASSQEGVLRQYASSGNADPAIMMSCRWALERITGEPIQPMQPVVRTQSGWFLEPIDPSR